MAKIKETTAKIHKWLSNKWKSFHHSSESNPRRLQESVNILTLHPSLLTSTIFLYWNLFFHEYLEIQLHATNGPFVISRKLRIFTSNISCSLYLLSQYLIAAKIANNTYFQVFVNFKTDSARKQSVAQIIFCLVTILFEFQSQIGTNRCLNSFLSFSSTYRNRKALIYS